MIYCLIIRGLRDFRVTEKVRRTNILALMGYPVVLSNYTP